MLRSVLTAAIAACLASPALAQQPTPAGTPVGTVVVKQQPVNKAIDFVGRVEAIDRVDVRA